MDGRKIIYITKKALENLPKDIPVYILIDPEPDIAPPPLNVKNNLVDQISKSHQVQNNFELHCFNSEESKKDCDFIKHINYEITNVVSNSVLESTNLIAQSDFNNDDFINSVDIISSDPTDINYDQIKTPEYSSLYHDTNDSFMTDFYECLRPDSSLSSENESQVKLGQSLSSTAVVSKTLESFINIPKNSFPTSSNNLFNLNQIEPIFVHEKNIANSNSHIIDSLFVADTCKENFNSNNISDDTKFYCEEDYKISEQENTLSSNIINIKPDNIESNKILYQKQDLQVTKPFEFNGSKCIENYDLPTQFQFDESKFYSPKESSTVSNNFVSSNSGKSQIKMPNPQASGYQNLIQASHKLNKNNLHSIWNINTSLPQIDISKPPPTFVNSLSHPHLPSQFSVPPPPIDEPPTVKSEEIAKIKSRRSAKRVPKRPLCFKEYQYVDMDINERYLVHLNKKKKTILGTKLMTLLEDKFENEILSRRETALDGVPKWEALDRSQFTNTNSTLFDNENEDDKITDKSNGSDNDSTISDLIHSDSDDDLGESYKESNFTKYQISQLAHIEKKVAATRKRLKLNLSTESQIPKNKNNFNGRKRPKNHFSDHHVPAKKAKQSTGYLTIQKNSLQNNAPVISKGRTIEQQAEINHKLKHPLKLHPDIWYNEANELNDGPACSCSPKYQIGPLHNKFPGEKSIPLCQSNSNNYGKLYHYRLIISPPINFLSLDPTSITYKDKEYSFTGYSIFTHKPLVDIPPCQVVRYNIVYFLSLVKEEFPIGFTVRTLDLITDYVFKELLELLDLKWWPFDTDPKTSCRVIHLLPRFERQYSANSVELLSANVILKWILKHAEKPLFDVMDLPRIHAMSQSEWSEYIDSLRGSLATFPGKKPSTIRIDQIDRISIESKQNDDVMIFPVIVHMSMAPMKLGLTREPAYKRLLRNFLKLQYLILNRPEVTQEDRAELNNLARLLENFEMNGIQRREFTVEICSDGFYRTGFGTDVVQFALCIPSIMAHIRFHLSLSELENRMKYVFKDKSLLHQALTHPSFRNTNYGTNPDHYQNTVTSCGLRHIRYGDKLNLYRSFRKKGLSKMVQVMSHLPYWHETRSNIFGNERLECLGDAVIELITSVHLFYMFPELSEGHLDAFRQSLVQNHYLAELSVRLGFHNYILYTHNMDFSYDSTITHARSDGFEAVMAAITLDGGLDEADRIFGSALFADDPRIHKVWCEIPLHPLQEQFLNGDRHVIRNSPLFENLTKLEDRLGIRFKHIRLLAKAMTIRKTGYNLFTLGDNQRLEFLGDSLLKYLTTDYLFKHFPRHHEGHISLLRNTLVNRYTQATVCTELGLDEFIIKKDNNKSNTILNKSNEKPKADLLEAFLGALFVDKDLKWVERFCQVCFWPRLVDFILNQSWNDPKSRLQQCCLTYRSLNEEPEIAHYKLITTFGSTDHREFKVAVYFRGDRLATGFGRSIQIAQMNAASQALETHKTEFRQLNYQEKVITDHYDYNTREKIMNQFENWDSELIDKFVTSDMPPKPMHRKLVPTSNMDVSTKNPLLIKSEKPKDRLKNIAFTSSLGELLKNMKKT